MSLAELAEKVERLNEQIAKITHDVKTETEQKEQKGQEADKKVIIEKALPEFENKLKELTETVREIAKQRQTQPVLNESEEKQIKNLLRLPATDSTIRKAHELNDNLKLVCDLLGKQSAIKLSKEYEIFYPKEMEMLRKTALDAGTAGTDWTPITYSRSLFEEMILQLKVAQLHQKISMPSRYYKIPIAYQDAVAYYMPENVEDTSVTSPIPHTKPTKGAGELIAKKIMARTAVTTELTEDALFPVLDVVKKNLVTATARAIETAIINGDTSDTHMDSDVTSSTDARKAVDGYRKTALDEAKVDAGGSLTVENLLSTRAKMEKYGVNPEDLALIVSPVIYLSKLINLKDSAGDSVVMTREKYGPHAVIVEGELAQVFGISVIVSEFVRYDLNASGVYDGVTTDKSEIILVHKPSFLVGYRDNIRIMTERKSELDQTRIVSRVEFAFTNLWSNKPVVGILYNIDV